MNARTYRTITPALFFCLCMAGLRSVQAQPLTVERFLSSALEDPSYTSYNRQEEVFRRSSSYGLPWIPNLEFRTRNNELLDSRQQYALRADLGNPWQIQRNAQYFKGLRSSKSLEQQLLLKTLMRDRYDLVLEYWYAHERVSLMIHLKDLRQQISTAMSQRSGLSDFDAEQYLNSTLEVVTKTADLQEAEFERDLARTKILQLGGGGYTGIGLDRFIDVSRIQQILIHTDSAGGSAVEIALLKQEIANAELKMKTDRLNFDLGFIQGMYAPYRASSGDGVFGLAAGVTIPLFNQRRDDIARERLKVIERTGAIEQMQRRNEGRQTAEASLLFSHIKHYHVIDSLAIDLRKREMNIPATLSKNYNPVVDLKYREKLVELDLLNLRIKREILRQYISYLDNRGRLHQRPLVNYLDRELGLLEE